MRQHTLGSKGGSFYATCCLDVCKAHVPFRGCPETPKATFGYSRVPDSQFLLSLQGNAKACYATATVCCHADWRRLGMAQQQALAMEGSKQYLELSLIHI